MGSNAAASPKFKLVVSLFQTRVKKIMKRAPRESVTPPLVAVFGRIMCEMAALTQCRQVARGDCRRIMIEMRAGQDNAGTTELIK